MSGPVIKGWCPGALRPMMSGDGLVVRVRAPFGRLTQDQGIGLAEAAAQFGNGRIDLSNRANLQIRGVREADHPALIEALQALDLVDRDIATETRRNLVIQPFWKDRDATHRLTLALSQALAKEDAPALPGKFGFAVDTGTAPVIRDVSADIRLEASDDGILVFADGATTAVKVAEGHAIDTAMELAHWFLSSGGAPEGRGRMARHLASGAQLPERFRRDVVASTGAEPPAPQTTPIGLLIALEFGQVTAEVLGQLAQIAPIRLTPWRMLLLEGLTDAPDLPGLIRDRTDPRLAIHVCTGAPGCAQGHSETRDLARDLAPLLPVGSPMHISGCAKGCAHPRPSAITLSATGADRFDLIRNGRAGDMPSQTGLSPDDIKKALTNAP